MALYGAITPESGPGVGIASLTQVAEQMWREGRGPKPWWLGDISRILLEGRLADDVDT